MFAHPFSLPDWLADLRTFVFSHTISTSSRKCEMLPCVFIQTFLRCSGTWNCATCLRVVVSFCLHGWLTRCVIQRLAATRLYFDVSSCFSVYSMLRNLELRHVAEGPTSCIIFFPFCWVTLIWRLTFLHLHCCLLRRCNSCWI